jgi:hypothetical protein
VRQSLNSNPAVQAVLIGVLAIGVGFLLLTRVMGGGSSDSAATDPAATTPAPTDGAGADAAATDRTAAPTDTTGAATATPDAAATPTPDAGGQPAPAAPAVTGGFEAGPGLPKSIVKAYERDDTVVLLVTKRRGIDDQPMRVSARILRGRPHTAVFTTNVHDVAKYSRLTTGVDLNRPPALVVLSPRKLTDKGALPTATVSYGFRSILSTAQAVKNAEYHGKQLPYYPK